jgi:DNA gyrase subunit A
MERPDLSNASPEVRAYIEALEAELAYQQRAEPDEGGEPGLAAPVALEPPEAPSTQQVITATAGGLIKRTARHLYERQRRGGMGIFDLDAPSADPPSLLAVADEADYLLLLTDHARAFRWPVERIPSVPVRGRGAALGSELPLLPGERLAAMLRAGQGAAIALLSTRGFARALPAHVVGQAMNPGATLMRAAEFGPLAAACWTSGGGDLFVATRRGMAIRFPERALPLAGGPAIRLEAGDEAVAVAGVRPPEGNLLFLLGADGRGTIRLMSGFAPNKSPGGAGKVALKTDHLAAAIEVEAADDILAISRLSKIIRFRAAEVPAKEGVVQGVHCMQFRADEVTAVAVAAPLA